MRKNITLTISDGSTDTDAGQKAITWTVGWIFFTLLSSGSGTNLKVGDTFLSRVLLAEYVFVGVYVMDKSVWSVSCLLFFYSQCPRAQPFVIVTVQVLLLPVPYEIGATVIKLLYTTDANEVTYDDVELCVDVNHSVLIVNDWQCRHLSRYKRVQHFDQRRF